MLLHHVLSFLIHKKHDFGDSSDRTSPKLSQQGVEQIKTGSMMNYAYAMGNIHSDHLQTVGVLQERPNMTDGSAKRIWINIPSGNQMLLENSMEVLFAGKIIDLFLGGSRTISGSFNMFESENP